MDKGGARSSKNRSGSCSSRVDANVVTYDADVDQVDIEEDDHLNNSDDAIIESDDDDDAGIFSIANDCSSEDDDTLADEQKEEELFLQLALCELNKTMSRQQNDFCWLEKQWSVSCRTPSLTRWTGRKGTLKRMEEQMFFHSLKAI